MPPGWPSRRRRASLSPEGPARSLIGRLTTTARHCSVNLEASPMPARRGAGEARARFSELLDAAERGDTTIILRRGKPVAAVAPIAECFPKRRSLLPLYGSGRGLCGEHDPRAARGGGARMDGVPEGALLLIDSAPIIYVLDGHAEFGPCFRAFFEAQERAGARLAVTMITIAEVLGGPLRDRDKARLSATGRSSSSGGSSGSTSTSPKARRGCARHTGWSSSTRSRRQAPSPSTPTPWSRMTATSRGFPRCASFHEGEGL